MLISSVSKGLTIQSFPTTIADDNCELIFSNMLIREWNSNIVTDFFLCEIKLLTNRCWRCLQKSVL